MYGFCRISEQQADGGRSRSFAIDFFSTDVPRGRVNLIQIGSQGREMQIAFEATPEPFSTQKFLVPYIMEGEIRIYNQRMLERFEIRSRLLFFCVAEVTSGWRFFDWRTRHTGPVDRELLVSLMGSLF